MGLFTLRACPGARKGSGLGEAKCATGRLARGGVLTRYPGVANTPTHPRRQELPAPVFAGNTAHPANGGEGGGVNCSPFLRPNPFPPTPFITYQWIKNEYLYVS